MSAQAGLFYFHGFNPLIQQASDLQWLLIDYNMQATEVMYPFHEN